MNKYYIDETEYQNYCSFKHIEPEIKGCLDREIAYEKEIEELKQSQNQIAIEKLENLKEIINNNAVDFEKKYAHHCYRTFDRSYRLSN